MSSMTEWIALLRGINVGGHKKVPMAHLRAIADQLWPDCPSRTYIASGNLIFHADGTGIELGNRLAAEIQANFGLVVPVLVLKTSEFAAQVCGCPFDMHEPKHVHGYFCFDKPRIDADLLSGLATSSDTLSVTDQVIWLHTANGFSKSKLAEKMTRVAGVELTARNLNTCRKLVEMLDG